jgi:hypothetical protein
VRFAMLASSRFIGLGVGVGPMVFDDQRRQLFISGCFQRAGASAAGDLTTIKCGTVANALRVLDVDAAAAAQVRVYDLTQTVHSNDTVAMEIDTAPTTGTRSIWATMRSADLLVQMNPPVSGIAAPDILRAVSLPETPADLKIIPRPAPATSNLIAVAAAKTGDVMIYDPSLDAVVAVLGRLGDTPWKLELLPGAPPGKAWLAASIFNSCRIALMEIPIDAPWNSIVRGRAGACPQ